MSSRLAPSRQADGAPSLKDYKYVYTDDRRASTYESTNSIFDSAAVKVQSAFRGFRARKMSAIYTPAPLVKMDSEMENKLEEELEQSIADLSDTQRSEGASLGNITESLRALSQQIDVTIQTSRKSSLRHDESKAASRIQAIFRGYQVRKDLSGDDPREGSRKVRKSLDSLYASHDGFIKEEYVDPKEDIEQMGPLESPEFFIQEEGGEVKQAEAEAATKIQSIFRGHQARKKFRFDETAELAEREKKEEAKAAIKIQAVFRGHKARKSSIVFAKRKNSGSTGVYLKLGKSDDETENEFEKINGRLEDNSNQNLEDSSNVLDGDKFNERKFEIEDALNSGSQTLEGNLEVGGGGEYFDEEDGADVAEYNEEDGEEVTGYDEAFLQGSSSHDIDVAIVDEGEDWESENDDEPDPETMDAVSGQDTLEEKLEELERIRILLGSEAFLPSHLQVSYVDSSQDILNDEPSIDEATQSDEGTSSAQIILDECEEPSVVGYPIATASSEEIEGSTNTLGVRALDSLVSSQISLIKKSVSNSRARSTNQLHEGSLKDISGSKLIYSDQIDSVRDTDLLSTTDMRASKVSIKSSNSKPTSPKQLSSRSAFCSADKITVRRHSRVSFADAGRPESRHSNHPNSPPSESHVTAMAAAAEILEEAYDNSHKKERGQRPKSASPKAMRKRLRPRSAGGKYNPTLKWSGFEFQRMPHVEAMADQLIDRQRAETEQLNRLIVLRLANPWSSITNSDILFQDAAWNNVKKTIASHELASKKERPSSAPSLRNTPKPTTPSPVEQRRLEYFSKLSTPRPKPTEPLLLPPSVRNAHTKIGPIDWDRIENLSRPRRRNVPITQEKAWAAIEAGRRPKKLKPMDPVVFERLTRPRSKPEPPPLPPQYKPTSPRKRLLKNSAAEPARETVEGGRISVEAGPEIVIDEHDENMLVEAKSKSVDFDALLQDIISGDLKKTPSGEQVESTESSAVKEFTPSKESDTSNSEEIRSSAQASQEQLFKEYSEASPEDSTVSAIDQTQISIRASKEQLTNDSIDTSSKLLEKEVYMEQIQTSSPAASDRLDASAESNQAVKEPLASIEAEEVRTRDLQEAIAVAESLRSFEKNGVSVISLPSLVSLHDLQDDVVGDAVGRILEAEVQQTSAHDNVISDVELLRQANMNGSRQSLSIRQASQSDVTPQSFQQENIDNVRNLMSLENQAPEKALEDMDSFFDNMVDSSSQPVEVDRLASKALEPEHHTEVETEGFEAGNADESNEEYFDNGPDIQQALDAPEYEDRYEPAKTNGENLDEMKGIYQREAADAEAEHNYLQQSQGADEVSITNNEISLQEGITAFEDIESFFDNTMTSHESLKKASLVSIVADAIPAAEEYVDEAAAYYDDDYSHLNESPKSVEDMTGAMNEEDVAAAGEFHENEEAAPAFEEGNIDEVIALRESLVEVRHSKSSIAEDFNTASTDSRHLEEGNPSHSNQFTEEHVMENTPFKDFTEHSDDQILAGNTDIAVGGTLDSLLAKDLDELLAEVENPTSLTLPHNTADDEGSHSNVARPEAIVFEDQSPSQDEAQDKDLAYNDDKITQELDALMAEVSLVPNSVEDVSKSTSPKSLAEKDDAGRSEKRMGSIDWEDDFFN